MTGRALIPAAEQEGIVAMSFVHLYDRRPGNQGRVFQRQRAHGGWNTGVVRTLSAATEGAKAEPGPGAQWAHEMRVLDEIDRPREAPA